MGLLLYLVILCYLLSLSKFEPVRPNECLSLIYCKGKLLDAVQRSGLFRDSKTFVDMPTKKPEGEVHMLLLLIICI